MNYKLHNFINNGSFITSVESKKKITEVGENEAIESTFEEENKLFIANNENIISVPTYNELLKNNNISAQEIAANVYNAVKQSQSAVSAISDDGIAAELANTITINSPAYNNSEDINNDNIEFESDEVNSQSAGNFQENDLQTVNKLTGKKVSESAVSTKVKAALDGTKDGITNAINAITSGINGASGGNSVTLSQGLNNVLLGMAEQIDMTQVSEGTSNAFFGSLGSILETMAGIVVPYQDGVSETSYGAGVESGWQTFIKSFKKSFFEKTPLDPSESRSSLYGNMMLNSPFSFGELADPRNRTLINSLIKDGKYVSFIPGLPKYNGSSYTNNNNGKFDEQTKTADEMAQYLKMNGLTSKFNDKDKRYYTFREEYATYYYYLEAMLNTIWVKMGLGKDKKENFSLFSFFNGENKNSLKTQYKSAIGFFANVVGSVSESIDNQITGFGSELASQANSNSDDYQRINYITGMGGGSNFQKAMRSVGNTIKATKQVGGMLSSTFANTISAAQEAIHTSSEDLVMKIANYVKIPISFAGDVMEFTNTQDLGAIIQSFATSNGMKVMYPELWSNSSYSKNVNFSFSFMSPYGDPLSIFKYVYVPFCALACLAMPRQAAENGYISPMFVRADVPGLMTSDLALITSFTFTKGGAQGLWTKDGLPRIIDVNITLSDLYPYLSMVKHISSLSANPSYAVFLDNMSGLMSLSDKNSGDNLNDYFNALLKRVNGDLNDNKTANWNTFNSVKNKSVKIMGDKVRASISATVDPFAIPWLHNSSI